MIKHLQKIGKAITPHYMWYWEGEEIIIPFATKDTAKISLDELSNEYDWLSFELKEVPKGWNVVITHQDDPSGPFAMGPGH